MFAAQVVGLLQRIGARLLAPVQCCNAVAVLCWGSFWVHLLYVG